MLAYLPAEEAQRIASADMESLTIPNRSRILKSFVTELELTRQRGYSIDDQGIREGVYAFGAPVFDATGAVVAAVSVCVSTASLEGEAAKRHRDVALDVAGELTVRLGGNQP